MARSVAQVQVETLLSDLEQHTNRADRMPLLQTLNLLREALRQRDDERQRSEDHFRMAVDAAGTGIWDWNIITGRLVWNEHTARMFGLALNEFEGTFDAFLQRVHPEDRQGVLQAVEAARINRTSYDHSFRVPHADGSVCWVRGQGRFHYDNDGSAKRMIGTAVDQTLVHDLAEQKRLEREHARVLRRLETLLDALPVGVSFSEDASCQQIVGNKEVRRQFQMATHDNLSASARDEMAHGRQLRFRNAGRLLKDDELPLQRAVAEGRTIEPIELEVRNPDGQIWYADASASPTFNEQGEIVGGVAVTVDITQRKLAEEKLRRSEQRLRDALAAGRVVAFEWDVQSDEVIRSKSAMDVLSFPEAHQSSGRQYLSMIHPEDQSRVREVIGTLLTQPGQRYHIEYRFIKPDGRMLWVEETAQGMFNPAGQLQRLSGMLVDVTDRRNAEEALRAAKQEAERVNQVKDQFLAVLSHELRTPLTPVLATAQMLEADPTLAPGHLDMVQMMRRNVELEARLIDDLLDLTRITRGKLEIHPSRINVHEKIDHVLAMCREEIAAKSLSVSLSLEAKRCMVHADPARFQQIIWNLLKNAIKFNCFKGGISIATSDEPPKTIRIVVQDNGPGIEPDLLPKIFQAFEQGGRAVTRQFGGLGLGLAITKALVELHGGTIQAISEGRGRGAVFTILLPITEPAEAFQRNCAKPSAGALKSSVLLVEDHADTRLALDRLLRNMGCRVRGAGSVAEALRLVAEQRFDLLISDIGLPDADGMELMRQVKSMCGMRGIALSGYGMLEDIEKSRAAGFEAHLVKPVGRRELEEAVRRVIEGPDESPLQHQSIDF